MRNIIGSAMVATMALSLFLAVTLFGAAGMNWAAPAFCLGFLACFVWGSKLILVSRVSWKSAPTHWPVLLFFLYTLIRYFISPLEYDSRVELIQVGFFTLVYFAAANNLYHSRDRGVFLGTIATLVVLQSAYGIWQVATSSDSVLHLIRPTEYNGRASGTYVCPNHLAGFLEMAIGLLLARVAFNHGKRSTSEKNVLRKVLLAYAALMAFAGIVSTFSRAGWMATAATLFALLLWSESRLRANWQRFAVGGAVALILISAAFFVPKAWERLNRAFLPDQTAGGRTLMWAGTVDMIKDAPLLGYGPGTWQWYHQLHRHPKLQIHPVYAHSDSLHLWADYGLVGFLLVIGFFVLFFWHVSLLTTSKTSSEPRSFAIGGALAVIAILAHSWGDFNLHIPANGLFLALICGYVAALDDPYNRFPRSALAPLPRLALGATVILASAAGLWLTGKAAVSAHYIAKGNQAKEILYWDDAEPLYERAIQADPRNPLPYFQLAEVHRSRGFFRIDPAQTEERSRLLQRSIELYQESLRLNPFQTQAMARLSHAYQTLGDLDKARETLEEALQFDPKSAFVYLRLGLIYRKIGDEEKAASAFAMSEQLNAGGDDVSRFNLEDIQPK